MNEKTTEIERDGIEAALVGQKIKAVEIADDYIVITTETGQVVYGDAPSAYQREVDYEVLKVKVTQLKKGDRFWNEYWNKEVICTTDAYRLDGTLDPEHYSATKAKPKVAQCSFYGRDPQWQQDWWIWEVGITDGRGSGGGWSEVEHRSIEVKRPKGGE